MAPLGEVLVRTHRGRWPEYRIRKTGRTWKLWHVHAGAGNVYYEHQIAESSDWAMVAWIATADPAHRRPGWILLPKFEVC